MKNVCAFFNVSHAHHLQWIHDVHDAVALRKACNNNQVMLATGTVDLTTDGQVVMQHPHAAVADNVTPWGTLAFSEWLNSLDVYRKGAKIRFASPATVQPALDVVNEIEPEVPLIFHADVLHMLDNDGFEPDSFVRLCQHMWPQGVISIGWGLKKGQDEDGRIEQVLIDQMADLLLSRLGGLAYTIEFQAGYTSGWDKGAAFLLEPIPECARPDYGDNVTDGMPTFRPDIFTVAEEG